MSSTKQTRVNINTTNPEVPTGNPLDQPITSTLPRLPISKEDLILRSPTLGATSALSQSFAAMGVGMSAGVGVGVGGQGDEFHPHLSAVPPPQQAQSQARGQSQSPSQAQSPSRTVFTDPFDGSNLNVKEQQPLTSPRFSFPASTSTTNNHTSSSSSSSTNASISPISIPIPIPQPPPSPSPSDLTSARRPSVSSMLFGTSPLPTTTPSAQSPFGTSSNLNLNLNLNSYPNGPISPPILSASAQAAWGKPNVGLGSSFSTQAQGQAQGQGESGMVGEKVDRGQGALRRLSLGSSARPKMQPSKSDYDQSRAPPAIVIDHSTDLNERAFHPTSAISTRSNPTNNTTTSSSLSSSSYHNPFSGLSMSLDDDHHEHDEYERSFGAIEGNLLERAKSIGSGPVSRTWTTLGRRKSLQENPHHHGDHTHMHDGQNPIEGGIKPRRVSFGWTGFGGGNKKPVAPTPTPAAGKTSTLTPGSSQVDGLPQRPAPQQEGLRVGRGRSGSTGQEGKKRSVSPMGEHLLRGSSHF